MSSPRKKNVPDTLRESMQPQPLPIEGSGLMAFATIGDLAQLQAALDDEGMLAVLNRLLRSDLTAISIAAQHCLMYTDKTAWSGDVDSLPIDAMELGRILADAVHRRVFGKPLKIELTADVA